MHERVREGDGVVKPYAPSDASYGACKCCMHPNRKRHGKHLRTSARQEGKRLCAEIEPEVHEAETTLTLCDCGLCPVRCDQ